MKRNTLDFSFHAGGPGTGGLDPAGVQHTQHVWQVALQKGVAIVAVSGPGDSLGNLCTN